jgi:Family of unknown function (DUF6481)
MKGFKTPTFSDRLKTAASARDAHVARFRARPAADDPVVLEQKAARLAAAAERELRVAERAAAKRAEELRLLAEQSALETAERAEREARQLREADEQAELQAQRKAARDARYAARKKRKA